MPEYFIPAFSRHDGSAVFPDLSLHLPPTGLTVLTGPNGSGKSTILRHIAGVLDEPVHIPQRPDFPPETAVQALLTARGGGLKPEALYKFLDQAGLGSHVRTARWNQLSGGERIRLLWALARALSPDVLLLDEPTNHLDRQARLEFVHNVRTCRTPILCVSHDPLLIDAAGRLVELSDGALITHSGGYNGYREARRQRLEKASLALEQAQYAVKRSRIRLHEIHERATAAGGAARRRHDRTGLDTLSRKGRLATAEHSQAGKVRKAAAELEKAQTNLEINRSMRPAAAGMLTGFGTGTLGAGIPIVRVKIRNHRFPGQTSRGLPDLDLELRAGERWLFSGANGTGKSTLLQLLAGGQNARDVVIEKRAFSSIRLDQHLSFLNDAFSVWEQVQDVVKPGSPRHEAGTRLSRYLFSRDRWNHPVAHLSGGERMRLALCCLELAVPNPDLVMLDEPLNDLDADARDVLEHVFSSYKGTLLLVTHDRAFADALEINRELCLDSGIRPRVSYIDSL